MIDTTAGIGKTTSVKARPQTNFPRAMEINGWNNRIFISTDSPIVDDDVRYRDDNLHAYLSDSDTLPRGEQVIESERDNWLFTQLKRLKTRRKKIKSEAYAKYRQECRRSLGYLIQTFRRKGIWYHKTGLKTWKRTKPYYGNRWVTTQVITVPYPHQRFWAPNQFRGLVSALIDAERQKRGIAAVHSRYCRRMIKFASANRVIRMTKVWVAATNRPTRWARLVQNNNGHVVNGRHLTDAWRRKVPKLRSRLFSHTHRVYIWQVEVPYFRIESITMNLMEKQRYVKKGPVVYPVNERIVRHYDNPDWKVINGIYNKTVKPHLKGVLADALHTCAEMRLKEERLRGQLRQQMNRMSTGTSVGYAGPRLRPCELHFATDTILQESSWRPSELNEDKDVRSRSYTKEFSLPGLGLMLRCRAEIPKLEWHDPTSRYTGVQFWLDTTSYRYAPTSSRVGEVRAGLPTWDTETDAASLKREDTHNLYRQMVAVQSGRVNDSDFQFSMTRSLGELKDSRKAIQQGRDFVAFVSRFQKMGSVEKILQSLDAQFMGRPVPGTVSSLRRKIVMLKKSLPIKARKAALLTDITLGGMAALYLCTKFFVEPTAADVATVLYQGWKYVTTINKPLCTLLDALYAHGKNEADEVSLRRRWYGAERRWAIKPTSDPSTGRSRHRTIEGAAIGAEYRNQELGFSYTVEQWGQTPLYIDTEHRGGNYEPYGRYEWVATLPAYEQDPEKLLSHVEHLYASLKLTIGDKVEYLDPIPNPHYSAQSAKAFERWVADVSQRLAYHREMYMRQTAQQVPVYLHEDVQGSVWIRAQLAALEDVFELYNHGVPGAYGGNRPNDMESYIHVLSDLRKSLIAKSVPWVAWELYPLSFLTDWFITTQNTVQILNSAMQRSMMPVQLQQRPWATARADVYYGESEFDAEFRGHTHSWSDGPGIHVDGGDPLTEHEFTLALSDGRLMRNRSYVSYGKCTGRLDVVERVTVRQTKCVARRTGLYRCIRGPVNVSGWEAFMASLPRIKVNLNTGKVTTILALLKGMIKF